MGFFLLRIPIFVEVDNPADGRLRSCRNFDQVKSAALSQTDRVADVHNSSLLPIGINHSHFRCSNMLVDANSRLSRWGRTKISTDKPPPPVSLRALGLMRKSASAPVKSRRNIPRPIAFEFKYKHSQDTN